VFPIDLDALDRRLQAYFGTAYYQNRWIDEQIKTNSRFVRRDPRWSSVSVRCDPHAMASARARAEAEAQMGARFPVSNVMGEEDLGRLPALLERLKEFGVHEIRDPLLPPPDRAPPYDNDALPTAYSDQQLAKLIEKFFLVGIKSYEEIVTRNFPGLPLSLYSQLPLSVVVSYKRPSAGQQLHWGHPVHWGHITYAFVQPGPEGPQVEVHIDSGDPAIPPPFPSGPQFVDSKGRILENGLISTDLRFLIEGSMAPGFGIKKTPTGAARLAPVRAFAYDLLRRDFRSLTVADLAAALGD